MSLLLAAGAPPPPTVPSVASYAETAPRLPQPPRRALQSTVFAPQLERAVPLAEVYYPNRVERWALHARHQAAVAQAFVDRTNFLTDVDYPDVVRRPPPRTEQQLAVPQIAPQPERAQLLADARYADRVDRPAMRAAVQLASPGLAPAPERALPLADAQYPARVGRAATVPQSALADPTDAANVAPALDPLTWQPRYPDRAPRTSWAAPGQPTAGQPEQTSPHGALAVYADRVDRPRSPASYRTLALDPQPERAASLVEIATPAQMRRVLAALQGDGGVAPLLVAAAPLLLVATYPDRLPPRPFLPIRSRRTLVDSDDPALVGPDGGQVVFSVNGALVTVTVPAGALGDTQLLLIADAGAPPALPGVTPLSPLYRFSPEGLLFAQPVTVTIEVAVIAPETYIYWSTGGGDYVALEPGATGATVIGRTSSFSLGFAGIGPGPSPDPAPASAGGTTSAVVGAGVLPRPFDEFDMVALEALAQASADWLAVVSSVSTVDVGEDADDCEARADAPALDTAVSAGEPDDE